MIVPPTLETDETTRHMLGLMTETTAPAARVWTPQGFRENEWTRSDSAEALAGNGRLILPLQVFLDLDPEIRKSAKERLGVELLPGDELQKITGLLDQLSLVALAFPAFSDGRSFSKAELLRRRHGFEGAIRATGEVLVDQLPHMLRLGFDEFEISHPLLLKRLEAGEIGGLPLYYQPTGRGEKQGERFSWRRRPQ